MFDWTIYVGIPLGVLIYVATKIVVHFFRSHAAIWKVLVHLEEPPGWITCPKCGGAQGWVNDHGVLRKLSDVSHTRYGNYGSKAEYLTRSFFAKGQRGGPHTFWVDCRYCDGRGVVPDHPARKHTGTRNITANHGFDPDKSRTTRRPHPRPYDKNNETQ